MIVLDTPSRLLSDVLLNRLHNLTKAVELDYNLVEFDDVRYHIQATVKNPHHMSLSISIPLGPQQNGFSGDLPAGAIEAVRGAYGAIVQIVNPPVEGFQLTLKIDLTKLPANEETKNQLVTKIASLRSIVAGAPLREILKNLALKIVPSEANRFVAIAYSPKQSFFVLAQAEKVTVVFPMLFTDKHDIVLGISFLQEFMEARRTSGFNIAPLCHWSMSPPVELKGAPTHALNANAGFASFVIFPRHVVGVRLDRTVWSLLTFHAYVSYHIKCSKSFMHTRMRRRVEILIEALDRAKPDMGKEKKTVQAAWRI